MSIILSAHVPRGTSSPNRCAPIGPNHSAHVPRGTRNGGQRALRGGIFPQRNYSQVQHYAASHHERRMAGAKHYATEIFRRAAPQQNNSHMQQNAMFREE
jgi:hypothetical protein